jgi:glutamate-1-semialdehyde aminotransferase
VRFGKNGSDATAGCIRIARAATGRDLVAVCGYHGWQDWYIGSTARDLGVPASTKAMTKKFTYNDIDSLLALFKAYPGEIAAVILEPMSFELPRDNFLHKVKEEAHKAGAILIFDEVVTGFRYPGGSAQAFTGVVPDMASIGKGMANGYPISAVVGRADLMRLMEEVFYSFTMGGELVSIAAALATLEKGQRDGVYDSIARVGQVLLDGVRDTIARHGLHEVMGIAGQPSWNVLTFKDQPGVDAFAIKTLFMQECFRRGVFNIGIHFLSFAHSAADVQQTLETYNEVFALLREALNKGTVVSSLDCAPLQPLFKVR